MNKQKYSASDVIFLLGAGATVDAGMPTVKDLTHCIRERLSHLGFNEARGDALLKMKKGKSIAAEFGLLKEMRRLLMSIFILTLAVSIRMR